MHIFHNTAFLPRLLMEGIDATPPIVTQDASLTSNKEDNTNNPS